MIGIIDYGMGNLFSVKKAVARLGYSYQIVNTPHGLERFDGMILPGVGAFGDAMERLNKTELATGIHHYVQLGKPLLGICLGMQLLFTESEEHGLHAGLNLLPGRVVQFRGNYKIPHMGWNRIKHQQPSFLLQRVQEDYVYFVHSYYVQSERREHILATTNYYQEIPAIVGKGNIFGVQFHPEKSGETGMQLLKNFLHLSAEQNWEVGMR